jgi:hypothetical protein
VPFTPLHMGPGILLKAILQGSFSLMMFGWAQIIMDLQPLAVLLTGHGHLHGFSHTYIGASLIGAVSALTGKYAAEITPRMFEQHRLLPISWPVAIVSAFIGSYSHVLIDSVMHGDLQPFAPFNMSNPFLGWVSVSTLHKFCLYSAMVGAALHFSVAYWLSRRMKSKPT